MVRDEKGKWQCENAEEELVEKIIFECGGDTDVGIFPACVNYVKEYAISIARSIKP